jgi:opacity protein-like surface antigen
MKRNLQSRIFTQTLCASVLWFTAAAFGQNTGFYVKGDVGGNVTQDIDVKEFFGPVAPGTEVHLDPGFRAGLVGGYQALDWLAGEVELGAMENTVRSITGATRVHDATFANVPLLFNVKLQYPNQSGFIPYAGAGAGFSEAIFDVGRVTLNGVSLHGNDADTVFAYQAFAGVRYQLNEQMGVSLEYHYFVADSPTWQADFTSGTGSDTMRFGRSQTHAISLAFEFRF